MAEHPIFSATEQMADHYESCDRLASFTRRTARSLTSGENLLLSYPFRLQLSTSEVSEDPGAIHWAMSLAPNRADRLRAQGNLALVLAEDEAHRDEARRLLLDIADTCRVQGDVRLMAHAQFNAAYVDHLDGDGPGAIRQGEQALERLRRIQDVAELSIVEPQLEAWKQESTSG